MGEERTLGLARPPERAFSVTSDDELSKEELRRRMEEARESISQTVGEIKETVVHQYEAVKDTLDWREQYRKRPVACTLGIAGVSFLVGYGIAAIVTGNGNGNGRERSYKPEEENQVSTATTHAARLAESYEPSRYEPTGPGFFERVKNSQAFHQIQSEASSVGSHLIDEVSKTAKEVIVPAAITGLRAWLQDVLPNRQSSEQNRSVRQSSFKQSSTYQPVSERS